jgi:hypothetical protein
MFVKLYCKDFEIRPSMKIGPYEDFPLYGSIHVLN